MLVALPFDITLDSSATACLLRLVWVEGSTGDVTVSLICRGLHEVRSIFESNNMIELVCMSHELIGAEPLSEEEEDETGACAKLDGIVPVTFEDVRTTNRLRKFLFDQGFDESRALELAFKVGLTQEPLEKDDDYYPSHLALAIMAGYRLGSIGN